MPQTFPVCALTQELQLVQSPSPHAQQKIQDGLHAKMHSLSSVSNRKSGLLELCFSAFVVHISLIQAHPATSRGATKQFCSLHNGVNPPHNFGVGSELGSYMEYLWPRLWVDRHSPGDACHPGGDARADIGHRTTFISPPLLLPHPLLTLLPGLLARAHHALLGQSPWLRQRCSAASG